MKKLFHIVNSFFITAAAGVISSCASTSTYINNQPTLKIQSYFNGSLKAHGIVLNRQGQVTRYFAIDMKGSWHQNKGTLNEVIQYNDGEKQVRQWHFILQDPNHFMATAKDAVGYAQGTQFGNAVHMVYTLNVTIDRTVYAINFDDWIYKMTDEKVINRTTLSKFGIGLGEVIITYDKK
jgi:hypothetical protein